MPSLYLRMCKHVAWGGTCTGMCIGTCTDVGDKLWQYQIYSSYNREQSARPACSRAIHSLLRYLCAYISSGGKPHWEGRVHLPAEPLLCRVRCSAREISLAGGPRPAHIPRSHPSRGVRRSAVCRFQDGHSSAGSDWEDRSPTGSQVWASEYSNDCDVVCREMATSATNHRALLSDLHMRVKYVNFWISPHVYEYLHHYIYVCVSLSIVSQPMQWSLSCEFRHSEDAIRQENLAKCIIDSYELHQRLKKKYMKKKLDSRSTSDSQSHIPCC